MDVEQVAQPGGGRPRLFRIPAPVVSPGGFRPYRPHEHPHGDQGGADVNQVVGHRHQAALVADLAFPYQVVNRDKRHRAQDGVREHVDDHVWREPGALQRGHQHLVVDIGLGDVHDDEDRREHRGERQYPAVTPTAVGKQPGQREEEGVPQAGFAHGA